jgi:NAD(P)-dependent dehydrogenase (short-subunit alcohol dehydrogenase family)
LLALAFVGSRRPRNASLQLSSEQILADAARLFPSESCLRDFIARAISREDGGAIFRTTLTQRWERTFGLWQMIDFDGQGAIVTGAGAGIGRETAIILASRGAKVLVNDPAPGMAQAVVDEIAAAGGDAAAETTPVGSVDAAGRIVRTAIERFGQVEILVNNAGISRPSPFGEDSDADIEHVFSVNLLGPYALMRAVWPGMMARGYGRILNTSSGAALGSGISGAYAPSKSAIIGLTKDSAISGKPHGIHVNAIMPTAHTALLENHPDLNFRRWIEANFPASLVAATSAFLVSKECAATGEVFSTGGGLVQRVTFYETTGLLDGELTPEVVRDNIDRICATEGGNVIARQSDRSGATRLPKL